MPQPTLEAVHGDVLPPTRLAEVLALCERAFHQDLSPLYTAFPNRTHVMAIEDGVVVSHALWITRWLQPQGLPILRTAYVEGVATEEAYRGRGLASAVMRALHQRVLDFDLAGLCTGSPGFYARLGWERWTGPLFIRTAEGLISAPDDGVMVLRLPRTPPLRLDAPMSAEWRVGELW